MGVEYGNSIDRLHTIHIKWTRPIPFDENKFKELRSDLECGWYYITRYFGSGKPTHLYIGKAKGFIYKRILQHTEGDSCDPFLSKRGYFEVRFGTVDNPSLNTKEKLSKRYHLNRFLLTVESALIQDAAPICNRSQSCNYTRWYKLRIINSNINESLLSHIIENTYDENILPYPKDWNGQLEI